MTINLILTNDATEIANLIANGFCPVECSIGGKSLVDDLKMDHHGELSELEGVAIRAYRDHFGARKDDPRFVVTGNADADATFAIAALAGLLPHPSREEEFASKPPFIVKAMTIDLSSLAETVNLLDTNPIGVDITQVPHGDIVKTWNAMTPKNDDTLGLYTGVGMWVNLTTGTPNILKTFFTAANESEKARIAEATDDLQDRSERISSEVLFLNGSKSWGFDVWYGRKLDAGTSEEPSGWDAPVAVAFVERGENVTIGCPNQQVAEAIFGKGGLKNVFPKLNTLCEGWGGREAIGGSPRGLKMTAEQAHEVAKLVAELVQR